MTWLVFGLTLLAASCGPVAPTSDGDLERLPDYQRARKAAESGDFRGAIGLYDKLLRATPDSARAHLELGLLYDEKMGDPVTAIYHYRQFLALEPNSNRKDIVEGYIERAKLTLAAKLPQSTAIDPAELTRLQNENATLRMRIAELEKAPIPPPAPPTTVTETPAPVTQTVTPPATETRTHTVQKGDTLQSLALRYYGTRSAWEKIYAANRAILPSKDQLKVGQQLVIP